MSRIGNNPVAIPEGVIVEVKDNAVIVKGGVQVQGSSKN